MTARTPDGRALIGRTVRLDPLTSADTTGLFAALDDPRVWAAGFGGGPAGRVGSVADFQLWVDAAIADDRRATVSAVRLRVDGPSGAAGTIVGTSSLGDVSLPHERIHLGWTAYSPAVWGTAVNPECKLLMLSHAFDDCGFGRVKIQTDTMNTRSQSAIARLGAVREGVLRRHQLRADGSVRDTVVFSILKDEWPEVRDGLRRRLGDAVPGS